MSADSEFMSTEALVNALAAFQKILSQEIEGKMYGLPVHRVGRIVEAYISIRHNVANILPEIFSSIELASQPQVYVVEDDGVYARIDDLAAILNEINFFMEMWVSKNSKNTSIKPPPHRVFISHGRSEDWRKVQEYVEKTVGVPTLELAQEPNKGRTIIQKLIEEADRCSFAVIVMTGDDFTNDDQIRARENVIHEIGYFQGRYGPSRVCLLHENGVNVPSNNHGIVYIPFPKDGIEAALGGLTRELKHL
ncbi:DNA-binding protein [Deinococcus detaillensis]|uniref:DNA-binding protein n=1 Tax=Deinococcus detaillensis TaxID=2592048 RepID=A0A553UKX1_9DEIO|nr:nucleotide-binding protein [Deinococcus detaillensis]TSA80849.1 DNA-binding protein [Deinococcus detaillensis]